METISIKVDEKLAKAYQETTPIKRQEIENLLTDFLQKIIEDPSLEEIKPLKGKVISYEKPFEPVLEA